MDENVNLQTSTPAIVLPPPLMPNNTQRNQVILIIFAIILLSVLIVIVFYNLRINSDKEAFKKDSLSNKQNIKIVFGGLFKPKVSLVAQIASYKDAQIFELSKKNSIDENIGYLTLCESSSKCRFWMKGINYPVDIIWFKENQIVDLKKNISPPEVNQPENELIIYSSSKETDKALTVTGGFSDKYGINIGDKVSSI